MPIQYKAGSTGTYASACLESESNKLDFTLIDDVCAESKDLMVRFNGLNTHATRVSMSRVMWIKPITEDH